MDWTISLWFLFNDENVTYLDGGPQDTSDCTSSYCLFYVETSYLDHHGSMQILPSHKPQYTYYRGSKWHEFNLKSG